MQTTVEQITECPDEVRSWLAQAVEAGASDLHLVAGHRPVLRVHGELREIEGESPLERQPLEELLRATCPPHILGRFVEAKNADFSYELPLGDQRRRFRVNYFFSQERMGACIRVIPAEIPDFTWAGFPLDLAERLVGFRNGLVLICGVTGAGKSTTLAMLINKLNDQGGRRIITIEEPLEYLFPKRADSVVTQREVGTDVRTFADGLRFGLRQDPDVILVGEIRDRETAQMALSAAETGHLVLSTLHTRDAKGAISRYADLFPQDVQSEIRSQLAMSLRAIVCQHLLPNVQRGAKRLLALEIAFNTSPISAGIRFGKLESIDNVILTSRADGMLGLDESIKRLLHDGHISQEVARQFVSDPTRLHDR